jgi:hypothetical protein
MVWLENFNAPKVQWIAHMQFVRMSPTASDAHSTNEQIQKSA